MSVFAEGYHIFQVTRRQLQDKHALQRERAERAIARKFKGVKVGISYKLILGIGSYVVSAKLTGLLLLLLLFLQAEGHYTTAQ